MAKKQICMELFNEALAIAPSDGTSEALEFGLEVAREELPWLENISCGLDIDQSTADFSCNKKYACPLKGIVKIN